MKEQSPKDRSRSVGAHRAHQSRWREVVLDGWPPGPPTNPRARDRYPTIGSCLAETSGDKDVFRDAPNLMSPSARAYTRERQRQLQTTGALAERDRLYRNLLSSQPLAFSVVGELRAHPAASAKVLSALTGQDVRQFETLADSTH